MNSLSVVELFQEKTQYNLTGYLTRVARFMNRVYPTIIEFYSMQNNLSANIRSAIIELQDLRNETDTVLTLIRNSAGSLDARFWEVVEMIDEIRLSFDYIENTPKWLRSVVTKGRYSYSFETTETLKQKETLELLSKRLGSSNKENDWVYIALRNDLPEEEYTPEGGISLAVQYFNKLSMTLLTVVDSNIIGEKVYGLDLNKKIRFVDDDLDVLNYRDTVKQAVNILVNLKQNDNPEFVEDGIQQSIIVGTNRNSLPFPILVRQLFSTFSKDDTLKSLQITEIKYEEDTMRISLQVETRINEVIQDTVYL